jgi:hypothetical protein
MADRTFEMELDRMFAASPAMGDNDLFVLQVAHRLDRGWTFRRLLIGGLGVAGGVIGGAQVLRSGILGRLDAFGARSDEVVSSGLGSLTTAHILPAWFTLDTEALWMSAALAVLAVGFALTRAIKEI